MPSHVLGEGVEAEPDRGGDLAYQLLLAKHLLHDLHLMLLSPVPLGLFARTAFGGNLLPGHFGGSLRHNALP